MEQSRIRELLELYFEAQTTTEQERQLAIYFATAEDIPADLLPYKAMFAAFDCAREVKSSKKAKVSPPRWQMLLGGVSAATAVAAALLLGVYFWAEQPKAEPSFICYINGVQVEDREVAMAETQHIFDSMSKDIELAMATIEKINIFELN